MKVLFIGSKQMGVLVLKEMLRKHIDLVGVVARWDDPAPNQWYPSVANFALENNITVFKPININDPSFIDMISKLSPDIIFTVFYPNIFRKPLLDLVSLNAYNLHFGPLPRYRGCFPGAWAIINGETSHGVTIHRMDLSADSGDIVSQSVVPVEGDETGFSLYKKCEQEGLKLFSTTWSQFERGKVRSVTQNSENVIYNKRGIPFDGIINFSWTANRIDRFVRALTFPPFSNPAVFRKGKRLVVDRCQVLAGTEIKRQAPGKILGFENGIIIQTGKGAIKLTQCRNQIGKKISLNQVIKRYNVEIGDYFSQ